MKRIQSRLVLEKIALGNIQISDEKCLRRSTKMADMYKMDVDKLKYMMGELRKSS